MRNSFYKVVLPLAFVLLAIAFIYLLNKYRILRNEVAVSPAASEIRSGDMNSSDCTDPCTGNLTWLKLSEAITMVKEYGVNQAEDINVGMSTKFSLRDGFKDSRFIVFPMDTIKNFICTIDKMLKESQPLNTDGNPIKTCDLGIKFFYAAYPGFHAGEDLSASTIGRHTLILVPTYLDAQASIYTEFFPSAVDPVTRLPYAFNSLVNWDSLGTLKEHKISALPLFSLSGGDQATDRNVGRNHGTLCPPPDGCFSAILDAAK